MLHISFPHGDVKMNVAPRIQSYCCPTCKGFIGEAAPIEAVIEISAPKQKAILTALASPVGRTVSRTDLITAVYPGYPPSNPVKVFHVHLNRLRNNIERFGWMIKSEGHKGTAYRLIPTGEGRL